MLHSWIPQVVQNSISNPLSQKTPAFYVSELIKCFHLFDSTQFVFVQNSFWENRSIFNKNIYMYSEYSFFCYICAARQVSAWTPFLILMENHSLKWRALKDDA